MNEAIRLVIQDMRAWRTSGMGGQTVMALDRWVEQLEAALLHAGEVPAFEFHEHWRQRSEDQLRKTLQMLCDLIWNGGRTREHVWTIPVDFERDFDCILGDAIDELIALRKLGAHAGEVPQPTKAWCEQAAAAEAANGDPDCTVGVDEPTDEDVDAAIDALAEKAKRGVERGTSGHAWGAAGEIDRQAELLKRALKGADAAPPVQTERTTT